MKKVLFITLALIIGITSMAILQDNPHPADYETLVNLFRDWRDFEDPPRLNGAPDYTTDRIKKDHRAFKDLQDRLTQIAIDDWSIHQGQRRCSLPSCKQGYPHIASRQRHPLRISLPLLRQAWLTGRCQIRAR